MPNLDPVQIERTAVRLLQRREPVPRSAWEELGPIGLTKLYALAVSPTHGARAARVRANALTTLGRLGAMSRLHAMFDALVEPDTPSIVRCGAIEGLGLLRTPRAVPVLQAQAFHADFRIRLYACQALGRVGTAAARRVLEDVALRDPHAQVRRSAQAELRALSGPAPLRLVETA